MDIHDTYHCKIPLGAPFYWWRECVLHLILLGLLMMEGTHVILLRGTYEAILFRGTHEVILGPIDW